MNSDLKQVTFSTLGGRSSFDVAGSVYSGVRIWYGKDKRNKAAVTADQFDALLEHFGGDTVLVGNGRRNRPVGSIGAWLQEHVTRAVIASYVAKILIEEGLAEKLDGSVIRFSSYSIRPKRRLNAS
jgi:hypothetical protein